MPFYSFLPVATVLALVPLAREVGVSKDPRLRGGFVTAYIAAGSHETLGEYWKARRTKAIGRFLAEDEGPMWQGGVPTRRHLTLVMWGYSPTPERLEAFVRSTSERAEVHS